MSLSPKKKKKKNVTNYKLIHRVIYCLNMTNVIMEFNKLNKISQK